MTVSPAGKGLLFRLRPVQVAVGVWIALSVVFWGNLFRFHPSMIDRVYDDTSESSVVGRLARAAADGFFRNTDLGVNVDAEHPSDGPVAKLSYSEMNVELCELALELLSSGVSVDDDGTDVAQSWYDDFLWSRAITISGGSSEIMRGLIGRQLLGRDHVRRDGNHLAMQRADQPAGIAVGRDHDGFGGQRSAARLDLPVAAALPRNGGDARAALGLGPCPTRRRQ